MSKKKQGIANEEKTGKKKFIKPPLNTWYVYNAFKMLYNYYSQNPQMMYTDTVYLKLKAEMKTWKLI